MPRPLFHFPIVLIGVFLFVHACGREAPEAQAFQETQVEVRTVRPEPIQGPHVLFASGRLAQREENRLSFKTGGIIERVRVREGQRVKAGQTLAELEPEEVQAQASRSRLGRDRLEIELQNARLALQLAERDYRNVRGLYADSVATLEQLENVEIKRQNARNQVQVAEAGLAQQRQQVTISEYNLRKAAILAPADGVVLRRLAEPNELVSPGQPVILLGRQDRAMVLRVHLADRDIVHVQLEDSARVWVDAHPDTSFRGVVRELASMADPLTGTYEVDIELAPNGHELLSGFIGTVHLFTPARANRYGLPVEALREARGRTGTVFVLEDGRARQRTIEIEAIQAASLIVDKGLDGSESVIHTGVGYLEDGMAVRLASEKVLSQHRNP